MTDIEKELLKGASMAAEKYEAERVKISRGKGRFQRDMETLDEKIRKLRREYDPVLLDIEQKFLRTQPPVMNASQLICPVCGEGDKGNTMNGKPWCFKCKSPLVPSKKLRKWMREKK